MLAVQLVELGLDLIELGVRDPRRPAPTLRVGLDTGHRLVKLLLDLSRKPVCVRGDLDVRAGDPEPSAIRDHLPARLGQVMDPKENRPDITSSACNAALVAGTSCRALAGAGARSGASRLRVVVRSGRDPCPHHRLVGGQPEASLQNTGPDSWVMSRMPWIADRSLAMSSR